MECTKVRVDQDTQFKANDSGFKDTGYHLFVRRGMFPFRYGHV